MSVPTIAPYFPFCRIKIIKQNVMPEAEAANIHLQPGKRFVRICQRWGQRASGVHSWALRKVQDLSIAATRVWITPISQSILCTLPRHPILTALSTRSGTANLSQ